MEFKRYSAFNRITPLEKEVVSRFLLKHLEEYSEAKSAIKKAIDYSSKDSIGLGGYIFTLEINSQLVGVVIINKTGMQEYIPENVLVYLAIHKDFRRKGLATKILKHAISNCPGNIAVHVKPNNPVRYLYEKLGFSTPYLEMRLNK